MTPGHNRFHSALLVALVATCSLDAAAQLPAAPQVVIDSNPAQQQPAATAQPAPATAQGLSAPTVIIQSNPGAAAPAAPATTAAPAPAFNSPTVTIQSNPGYGGASPATTAAPIPTPAPAPVAAPATAPKAAASTVSPAAAAPVSTPTPDGIGTTIFGEQEAPIGLYITPWKDDYAERGLDRPARLLDEAMEPIDPATFRRQIEYYETITEFRRKQRGEAK